MGGANGLRSPDEGQIFFLFFSFLFFHVGLELRSIHIIYRYFTLSRNPSQPFLLMILYIYI